METEVLVNNSCTSFESRDSGHSGGRANILGFEVDRISLDDCVRYLDKAIEQRQSCHVVLVNAAKIVKAYLDKELALIINSADLVGADGVPIVWASWLFGRPLPGRVNGTDLMDKLIELSVEKGHSVYLLGARQEVIDRAVEGLCGTYPSLKIAGYRNGYFATKQDELNAVADIVASKPDVLFVGMSSPMKEKWVRRHIDRLSTIPVIHGVGGSFDILSGLTKRAPRWMQNCGLEWFYRVLQEPGRMWKRYLFTNSIYIALVMRELLRRMFRKSNKSNLG